MIYIYVGCAGVLGAVSRYGIGLLLARPSDNPVFPVSTLIVNLLGCFLLGTLAESSVVRSWTAALRTALLTGFIGSFTTFSTLSVETVLLLQNERWGMASAYVLISITGGLGLTAYGRRFGKAVSKTEEGQ